MVADVPLRRLAEIARTESLVEHEPSPWNVRAAVGSDRVANALMGRDGMTYDYGDTSRRYVVALDGHFTCDPCGASAGGTQAPTEPTSTTSSTTPVTVSTMVLTVDPATLTPDGSFRLVGHEVDMTSLGKVYDLDPYLQNPSAGLPSGSGGMAMSIAPGGGAPCPAGEVWLTSECGPPPGPGNGYGPQGECTGRETAPPCGPGVVPGQRYAYTLPLTCDGRTIFDGKVWDSELPPDTNLPPRYVWITLAAGGDFAGWMSPFGAVGLNSDKGGPPRQCPPPTTAPTPPQPPS